MIGYYSKIGEIDGKSYYFNIPYNSTEKFVDSVSGEYDYIGSAWFGYDREKIVKTMYAVEFWAAKYEGWDSEKKVSKDEYKIHYHMMSSEGYQNTYNPTLYNKEKKEDYKFDTMEELCEFLINFMKEYGITEVNTNEITKDIKYTTKEVKRSMNILERISNAMNYE